MKKYRDTKRLFIVYDTVYIVLFSWACFVLEIYSEY